MEETNKNKGTEDLTHASNCRCGCSLTNEVSEPGERRDSRREFFKTASVLGLGLITAPLLANTISGDAYHQREIEKNSAVRKGKAEHLTILHTSDIHAQLHTHDEFFLENDQPVYKKRGGFAVLKTMLNKLRAENPGNTILIDGGDCFQGGGVAALSQGKAIVPLVNAIGYDLILPGNWEVVYGKEMMSRTWANTMHPRSALTCIMIR